MAGYNHWRMKVLFERYEGNPILSLALSRDLKQFKRRGAMLPPEDKDASLFPRKIGRCYVMLHLN